MTSESRPPEQIAGKLVLVPDLMVWSDNSRAERFCKQPGCFGGPFNHQCEYIVSFTPKFIACISREALAHSDDI